MATLQALKQQCRPYCEMATLQALNQQALNQQCRPYCEMVTLQALQEELRRYLPNKLK
jgi:hypothetical protein